MPKLSSSKVTLSQVNMIVSIKGKTKDKFDNKINEEIKEKFNVNESFELSSPLNNCVGIKEVKWNRYVL